MHASRFDTLARALAGPVTRRTLGHMLTGLTLGGALGPALAPKRALAAAASAAVCLDGANPINLGPQNGVAQTFTPTLSGKLSQVDVTVSHDPGTTSGYLIRILNTDMSGTPVMGRVMAKKALAAPSGGTMLLTFRFKKRKAAQVVAGTVYAFLVTRTDPAEGPTGRGRTQDPCPGGHYFSFTAANNSFFASSTDRDIVFEAFVGY